jgi:hypothetical protein
VEPYEVYAIKYATLARTGAENFIGGDPHDTSMRLDYYVWLRAVQRAPSSSTPASARRGAAAASELLRRRGKPEAARVDAGRCATSSRTFTTTT